jgi:hypothetical protein
MQNQTEPAAKLTLFPLTQNVVVPNAASSASASVSAPSQIVVSEPSAVYHVFGAGKIQGRGTQAHRGRIAMFKIVGTLPVKTRLPLVAWVLAGLVTLFSLGTSLTQVSGPMVQAAKPETAHYASMTDLLNLFGAL